MDDDRHPMIAATNGDAEQAAALIYLATLLCWLHESDGVELAFAWVATIRQTMHPTTRA